MISVCALLSCIVCLLHIGGAILTIDIELEINFVHHDEAAVKNKIDLLAQIEPDLCKVYSIGKSIEGRDLWVLAIGGNFNTYIPLRPHVKYVANMHGNEVVGREVLLHLANYFVSGYRSNSTIQRFLNTTVVHLLFSMNPDGYAISREGCTDVVGRYNKNNADLNRNFPNVIHGKQIRLTPLEPETLSVMNWLSQFPFVLSANLHGGAMVANYPYDHYDYDDPTRKPGDGPSICPDDDTFKFLASTFANSHASMAITNGTQCLDDFFLNGITNGAEWYPVVGGMQDFNYLAHGIFELTLEIGCCKYPPANRLEYFWIDNKDALVNLLMEVQRGVKGLILNKITKKPIVGAKLVILGRESVPFRSVKRGEYYRLLMPGEYSMKISFNKFKTQVVTFSVTESEVTRLDIRLELDRLIVKSNEIISDTSSGQPTIRLCSLTLGCLPLIMAGILAALL